jgi:ATP-dependent DNA ligase
MARADEPYQEGKRSAHLAKLKEFLEEDFEIIGVTEGVGKMAGLAIFDCRAANGNPFAVKLEGELEGLRKYLVDERRGRARSCR